MYKRQVGEEMRATLAERSFPVSELVALASDRSAGKELAFGAGTVVCRELTALSLIHI